MRIAAPVLSLSLSLTVVTLISCTTTQQSTPIDAPSLHEGLERVAKPNVDAVYRKPGVDVSKYNKLLLRPIEVQFAKNWQSDMESSSVLYRMDEKDRQRIKQEIASNFADVFKEELQTKGGYQLVDTPAPDVLEMRAALVNIYITAPDMSMQTAGRTRTFTTDAGEMTLIAELHDSVTGELLSRAYDRKDDMGGSWQWTNSVTNVAEARRAMKIWADTLRGALDASRAPATQRLSER